MRARSPGVMTVVDASSSIKAGPVNSNPGLSVERFQTAQSNRPVAWNHTSRYRGAGAAAFGSS